MRNLHFISAFSALLVFTVAAAEGCGSDTTSGGGGSGGSASTATNGSASGGGGAGPGSGGNGTGGAASGGGGTTSTGGGGGAGGGNGCGAGTPVALTVLNYISWCNVSINGATPTSMTPQTVCVAAGSTVDLTETPLSGFDLGLWYGDDNDTNHKGMVSGMTSSTTKTVGQSGTDCISVCCPGDPNGPAAGESCPPGNQCP